MPRIVRALCTAALVAGATFAAASPGWTAAASGGTYTTYDTNPGFRETRPIGSATSSSFDLTDAAPMAVEGDIVLKGAIAQHQLRFADARVLAAAAGHIPAGTVLVRVTTDERSAPVVWCDVRPKIGGQEDCLADSTGSGEFDQILTAYSPNDFLGFGGGGISTRQTLDIPVVYRTATVAERPTALLGYQWCDGDGVTTPPRFAYAVNVPGDDRWISGGALGCAFGGWPDSHDHQHVDLDGHRLTVAVDAKTGHMHYRFEGRIPPMAGLKPLVAGAPLTPPTLTASADAAAQQAASSKPLVADGRPPIVVSGALTPQQPFFTVGVRHGLTGVLIVEAQDHATFSAHTLPAGTPVYGIPMAGSSAAAIVWCAPQQAAASGGQLGRWTTYCMPAGDRAFMWIQAKPAMMPLDLSWGGWTGKMNSAPTVERRPATLPPMTLSYAFGGWNKDRWLVVLVQLDWGEGPQTLHAISVPPSADGSARLKVMGGEMVIRPLKPPAGAARWDQDVGAVAEVVSPPRPDADIAY